MDQAKLIKAREYYDKVKGGASKEEASLAIYGKKTPTVEKTQEYLAIVSLSITSPPATEKRWS